MRENRKHGSIGGRWQGHPRARRNMHPHRKPAGLSPSDLPGTPNQRPTSPFRAGVASRPARQAAPRPGGACSALPGRPHPDGALRAGKRSSRPPACTTSSPRVLTTRTGASRSRETVDPGSGQEEPVPDAEERDVVVDHGAARRGQRLPEQRTGDGRVAAQGDARPRCVAGQVGDAVAQRQAVRPREAGPDLQVRRGAGRVQVTAAACLELGR